MRIVETLSALVLRQLIDGTRKAGEEADAATRRLADCSTELSTSLGKAVTSAWAALEIALAGKPWCQTHLESTIVAKLYPFLDSAPLTELGPETRQECLREARSYRQAGLVASPSPEMVARQLTSPADGDWQTLDQELTSAGYPALGKLLCQRPPLLVDAIQYFFHRQAESDPKLSPNLAGLPFQAPIGFDALAEILTHHGDRLQTLLDGAAVQVVPADATSPISQAVNELLARYHLDQDELRPADILSIEDQGDRSRVKELSTQFSLLPEDQQHLPPVWNGLGRLAAAAGDLDAALAHFQKAAASSSEPSFQATALFNAYQAALEQRDWRDALPLLQKAAALAADKYAPFPLAKYEPERILQVGASGVSFLCRNRPSNSRVVVKALWMDGFERSVADVFHEARILEELDHPAIHRLRDCDYADAARTIPYLVIDYFEGLSLADHVQQHGPLTPEDLLNVARPVAEALHDAHARGLWHRDIKPANLLVRKEGPAWRVKLIDFGLALKPRVILHTMTGGAVWASTAIGSSAVATMAYSAPEQLGWIEGPVGPHSDVYAFGKVCYYALLGTPEPDDEEKETLPPAWRKLLGGCTARKLARRLPDFKAVLERLSQLTAQPAIEARPEKPAPPQPEKPAPAQAAPPIQAPDARATQELVHNYLSRGMALRQQGDHQRAILAFTKALQLDPRLPAGYIKRGNTFSDLGQYDRAIADYTAAIRADPKLALAYMNRGLAHARKGEYEAVINDCTEALRLDPRLAPAYFIRGAAYSSRGERHRAIAEFTLALRLDPKNALAYNDRGMAFAEDGEHDRAIKDYTEAIRLEPRLTLAYLNRGIAYCMKREYERAVTEFTKALHLDANNVLAFFNRGLAQVGRKAFDHGIADFDRVLKLDPNHLEAANRREEALNLKERSLYAKANQARAVRRQTQLKVDEEEERRQVRAAAYFARGMAHLEKRDFTQAISEFTKALQVDPKDAQAFFNRGLARVGQEDFDEALADFTDSLRLNPKNAFAYCHRGVAHRLRGDADLAINDSTRALRLDPNLALAYYNRSLAYVAKGDSDRAKVDYDEAHRLDPNLR